MTFFRSFVSLASVSVVVASSASTGRAMTPVRATALNTFSIDFIRSNLLGLMTRPTASLHLKQPALSVVRPAAFTVHPSIGWHLHSFRRDYGSTPIRQT